MKSVNFAQSALDSLLITCVEALEFASDVMLIGAKKASVEAA